MHRRPVRRALAAALVVAAAAASGGQAPPTDQRRFQSGIDIVLVDVTVIDRGGAPVTTLEPGDFTLTVDGQPRRVHSVRLVSAGEAAPPPDATSEGAAPAAPAVEPRRFVLVIDREHVPAGEGQQVLAAAARFVDGLPPGDGVALMTSAVNASSFNFAETRDGIRDRIRRSVGTYRPPFGPWNVGRDEAIRTETDRTSGVFTVVNSLGMSSTFPLSLKPIIERECHQQPDHCPGQVQAQVQEIARDARERADAALANLGTLIDALADVDGPKHVVLVTGGPVLTPDNLTTLASLGARAARARVTVHALQVRDPGYQARTDQMRAAPEEIDQAQSAAYALAATTGGLALTPVSGEIGFSRLRRELSAGYVLAFEIEAADRDGKAHGIDVKVRDRGWGTSVRARRTFRADAAVPALAVPALTAAPPAGVAAAPDRPAPDVAPPVPVPAPAPPPAPAPAAPPATPADREMDDVVQKMSAYVAGYGAEASVIVGVEKYTQRVTVEERSVRPRMLVSEFAIVKAAGRVGWSGFRDVVEVDGKPVSDRRDRLMSLLTGPAGGEAELRRIADESARYNVGPVIRNFNVPTTALFFFHPELAGRFTFRRAGTKKIDGVETLALEFKETARPTLVMKGDGTDVPCEGTVWVNPADGTIVRTRLRLRNFANLSFMSGGDPARMGGAAVAEFVTPPPQQATVVQPPAPAPPPAQAQPPQGTPPPPGSTGATGQTTTGGVTSTRTTGGESAPRPRPQPADMSELFPSIVELDSLVDIEVTYRREAASGIWMPVKMTELYEGPIPLGTHAPVRGRTVAEASYSNFKRFETSVRIVVPR
ncbi:MAG: VWA domain-containing protein [Vicinamibacterales bacterium]